MCGVWMWEVCGGVCGGVYRRWEYVWEVCDVGVGGGVGGGACVHEYMWVHVHIAVMCVVSLGILTHSIHLSSKYRSLLRLGP